MLGFKHIPHNIFRVGLRVGSLHLVDQVEKAPPLLLPVLIDFHRHNGHSRNTVTFDDDHVTVVLDLIYKTTKLIPRLGYTDCFFHPDSPSSR